MVGRAVKGYCAGAQKIVPFCQLTGSPKERIYSVHFIAPNTLWLGRLGILEAYQWQNNA